jgi:hypothetical protein
MKVLLEMKQQIFWQEWDLNICSGPEPACGISAGVAKKAVRAWKNRNHKKHWESITELREAKGLVY